MEGGGHDVKGLLFYFFVLLFLLRWLILRHVHIPKRVSNPVVRKKLMLQERGNNCRSEDLEVLRKDDPNFLSVALSICLL